MTATYAAAQERPHELRFGLTPAIVRQDDSALDVHVVAMSGDAVLVYGSCRLRPGAIVSLFVDGSERQVRVQWCDGRRARLDAVRVRQGIARSLVGAPGRHPEARYAQPADRELAAA